jgi:ribonuclease D
VGCFGRADLELEDGPVSNEMPVRVVQGDLPGDAADAFAMESRVAWDVETTGLDWRRDRLATCQLSAGGVGTVVVALGSTSRVPGRLGELLENPAVEKVFHHAPFDLRFMVSTWGTHPAGIRCTKVASKLLGPEQPNDRHSLQQLAKRFLGVTLEKGQVRTSDWTRPDLTSEQIAYASDDVAYLLPLLDALTDSLSSAGLARLYDACCAFLPTRVDLELAEYPDVFAY